LIDAQGKRVRLEEYILRPQPNQFKFVVLDQRDQRLDYFFYQGTFNKNLPTDLSVPLKELSGTLGATAPDFYLTSYEMGQSNTQDSVHDTATGGHLVNIAVNSNGDYVLTDPTNPSNTRTVTASQLQNDGNYKIYDPLSDSFAVVTPAQLAVSIKFGVYIPENDSFKDLAPGDMLWKPASTITPTRWITSPKLPTRPPAPITFSRQTWMPTGPMPAVCSSRRDGRSQQD